HAPISACAQASEARITIVAAQTSGFGKLGLGAFGLAVEGIGRREGVADLRVRRSSVARLFEPEDGLVGARLQQMHAPNLVIPKAKEGIAGAEADGFLYERDRLLYRPSHQLALA